MAWEICRKLFNPATIAVIGATEKEGTFGRAVLENALTSGNRKVYPVNPNRRDGPGSPLLVRDRRRTRTGRSGHHRNPRRHRSRGRRRLRPGRRGGSHHHSAGFRETGAEGKRLEEEILRINKAYGMRIIGPNCLGIMQAPRQPQSHLPP